MFEMTEKKVNIKVVNFRNVIKKWETRGYVWKNRCLSSILYKKRVQSSTT